MDFAAVLAQVAAWFGERRRPWALVGGVGLAASWDEPDAAS